MVLFSFIAALGLAAVHLFSQTLRLLQGISRNQLISIVGGMAVAFVILRLLPAVAQHQQTLAEATSDTPFGFLNNQVYALRQHRPVAIGGCGCGWVDRELLHQRAAGRLCVVASLHRGRGAFECPQGGATRGSGRLFLGICGWCGRLFRSTPGVLTRA